MAFTAGGRFNFITAKGATSVQEDHFHSVYFAAGTAICLGPTLFIAPSPCEKQDAGHEGVALEIGRASCRERGEMAEGDEIAKRKRTQNQQKESLQNGGTQMNIS